MKNHTMSRTATLAASTLALLLAGCGSGSGDGDAGIDEGSCEPNCVNFSDADPNAADAGPNTGCDPNGPQCNNCIDDDLDGFIDGDDPHCISPLDDNEFGFATGIPGDNQAKFRQDCFFDGNTGSGDDGCNIHTCCLLTECPDDLAKSGWNNNKTYQENFDANCGLTEQCKNNCGPLSPPGCDCFGCCTICHDGQCHDVYVNPAIAPDCDLDVLGDPDKCPPCTPHPDCGSPCDPAGCILCPGQTADDLPPECEGQNECPSGQTACEDSGDCQENQYCNNKCCVFVIQ